MSLRFPLSELKLIDLTVRMFTEPQLEGDRELLAAVVEKSRERAFKQLIRDVDQKMRDDPQSLKDMKKFLRDGTFTDEGGGVKVVNPTVMDRALFFKKIGDRWFLENRQAEEPKKEP